MPPAELGELAPDEVGGEVRADLAARSWTREALAYFFSQIYSCPQ